MDSSKLLISPVATADEILAARAKVIFLGNTNEIQARVLTKELRRRAAPGARILVARLNGCVYGVSMADHLVKNLRREFGRVDIVDLAQLAAIRNGGGRSFGGYDHIFVPTLKAEAAQVVALLWKDNPGATFWGTDGWDSLARYVRELPFARKLKLFWIYHYHPDIPTREDRLFARAYRDAYRSEPTDTSALYYEAAMLTFQRLAKVADPPATFAKIGSYPGITGKVRVIDHHVSQPMPLLTLSSEKPEVVRMVTAE